MVTTATATTMVTAINVNEDLHVSDPEHSAHIDLFFPLKQPYE